MLRIASVTLLALGILAGCKNSRRAEDNEHRSNEPRSAFTQADREARDRARKMARLGAECDASAGAKLDACRVACEFEHSNSCGWIAADYEVGRGVDIDLAEALRYYLLGCSGGSGLGCHGAARSFSKGNGVAPDAKRADKLFAEARFYYRVHCTQGHALSCSRLADLFATGDGGVADIGVSETYKLQACNMGRAEDCAPR